LSLTDKAGNDNKKSKMTVNIFLILITILKSVIR
jgi:hypothetical protein